MQRADRDIQLVAFRVFQQQKFGRVAIDVEYLQALIATDTVLDVHDR